VIGGEPLGNASDCDDQLRATATSEGRARSASEQQAPTSEEHKRATGNASDCDEQVRATATSEERARYTSEQQAPTSEEQKRATGTAAQEAARLIEAIGEWLAVRAGGTSGGSWAQWGSEHIATGAPECQLCPLCRLIAAARAVGPEVASHVDDAMQAFAAALRVAADAVGNRGGDAAGPHQGFQTIVIN
jgi:hypothetical protein